MHAIGAPVYWRLVLVYTLSATIAGVAGGLITQTNQFVGLNVLSFESAGELLVMLILGGVGRIYGAFVGPVVYLIAQDLLAKQFPEYWYFGIGTLLVLAGMFARGGVLGILDRILVKLRRKRGAPPLWRRAACARAPARSPWPPASISGWWPPPPTPRSGPPPPGRPPPSTRPRHS